MGEARGQVFEGVFGRAEAHQAVFEQIHPEGVKGSDCHVEPQIVLDPVDQMRLVQVPLHHRLFVRGDSVQIVSSNQPNAAPTTAGLRLQNPDALFGFRFQLQQFAFVGQMQHFRLEENTREKI